MTSSCRDRQSIIATVRSVLERSGYRRELTLDEAKLLACFAEERACELGIPVSISVCDASGGMILSHRMDGALPASSGLSINKAFTAASFRMATDRLGGLAQPGQPLFGIQETGAGRVVVFGGGIPCPMNGATVGAVGISGGTVEEDMHIASFAVQRLLQEMGATPEENDDE